MNERTLVTQLKRALCAGLPGAVVFKHHDTITAGIPDLSVTWRGTTTWIEVKYNTTRIRPLQHNTLIRLRGHGSAFYVVYRIPHTRLPAESLGGPFEAQKTTWVTVPGSSKTPVLFHGWAHSQVAAFIRSLHLAAQPGVEPQPVSDPTNTTTPDQDRLPGPGTPATEE
jgi:hypothetical protein